MGGCVPNDKAAREIIEKQNAVEQEKEPED